MVLLVNRRTANRGSDIALTDTELGPNISHPFFDNETVQKYSWKDITVRVKDRKSGEGRVILSNNVGHIAAGNVLAIMGPSGSGKTTLLNVIADRSQHSYTGDLQLNEEKIVPSAIHKVSSFVEQEDALIGSLTVSETVKFTARLAEPGISKTERRARTRELLLALGLREQKDTIVGTPIKPGISGGQKRRLSIATQLVAGPKILILDEPTSGLDSVASYEVINFISRFAKKHQLIVILSIHQPSTTVFEIFDSVMLLARGKTCYFGPTKEIRSYFNNIYPIPQHTNPAEYLLELVNMDFVKDVTNQGRLDQIFLTWEGSMAAYMAQSSAWAKTTSWVVKTSRNPASKSPKQNRRSNVIPASWVLLRRNWIKSRRDILTYVTRVVMYLGLAAMMGTIWLRLSYVQSSIQPFTNAIFFGGAFMSFMAVAYVPSILEDITLLKKEHDNGLCGPLAFSIANFIIGLPWLFAIALSFSAITYWASNFHDTAQAFWIWVLYLFLDLLAAESLVVLLSAITFQPAIALAAIAFANGLWMAVGGFLVPLGILNVFWRYVFHYIDYQAYVFKGMMINQFKHTVYDCDSTGNGGWQCMFPSTLQAEGKIEGTAVLDVYHISHDDKAHARYLGIMVAIIVVYRILGYAALVWRIDKR